MDLLKKSNLRRPPGVLGFIYFIQDKLDEINFSLCDNPKDKVKKVRDHIKDITAKVRLTSGDIDGVISVILKKNFLLNDVKEQTNPTARQDGNCTTSNSDSASIGSVIVPIKKLQNEVTTEEKFTARPRKKVQLKTPKKPLRQNTNKQDQVTAKDTQERVQLIRKKCSKKSHNKPCGLTIQKHVQRPSKQQGYQTPQKAFQPTPEISVQLTAVKAVHTTVEETVKPTAEESIQPAPGEAELYPEEAVQPTQEENLQPISEEIFKSAHEEEFQRKPEAAFQPTFEAVQPDPKEAIHPASEEAIHPAFEEAIHQAPGKAIHQAPKKAIKLAPEGAFQPASKKATQPALEQTLEENVQPTSEEIFKSEREEANQPTTEKAVQSEFYSLVDKIKLKHKTQNPRNDIQVKKSTNKKPQTSKQQVPQTSEKRVPPTTKSKVGRKRCVKPSKIKLKPIQEKNSNESTKEYVGKRVENTKHKPCVYTSKLLGHTKIKFTRQKHDFWTTKILIPRETTDTKEYSSVKFDCQKNVEGEHDVAGLLLNPIYSPISSDDGGNQRNVPGLNPIYSSISSDDGGNQRNVPGLKSASYKSDKSVSSKYTYKEGSSSDSSDDQRYGKRKRGVTRQNVRRKRKNNVYNAPSITTVPERWIGLRSDPHYENYYKFLEMEFGLNKYEARAVVLKCNFNEEKVILYLTQKQKNPAEETNVSEEKSPSEEKNLFEEKP